MTGDGYPYGLSLILQTMTPLMHGGDPVLALDQDALLDALRGDIKNPAFIKNLARRLLLDNPHRVRMTMTPDPGLNSRELRDEAERLATLKASLDDAAKARIVELAAALEKRQNQEDDPEILPRVTLADVPADLRIVEGAARQVAGLPVSWYAQGTNGMVYQQLVVDLPQFEDELLDLLPLYTLSLTECGYNGYDYLTAQARQAAVTGGVSAGTAVRGGVSNARALTGVFTLCR